MLSEWLDTSEDGEWKPVDRAAFSGFTAAVAIIAWFVTRDEGWVPLLDSANLAFHEAGHPLFGLMGERITVHGGTMGQLMFPLVVIISFLRKRETLSIALAITWFCENMFNIGRYMADARAQILPLVGNGEHDWAEIFMRWGMLEYDLKIAASIRLVAWIGLLICWIWMGWRCYSER